MATAAPEMMGDPVQAARDLLPAIRARGAEIEQGKRLPPDLVDAMVDAGLFHLFLPRDLGGVEADPVAACQAIEAVASADGSAGWCVMLAAQSAAFAGFIDASVAREIYGNGGIVAAVARPIGRAIPTDGGYTVSGRWPFASGSSHATSFAGECVVYDGDQPRTGAAGNTISHLTFFPRDAVTVHDTWDTTGLRGTASNDFSVESVHVPAARSFQMLIEEPKHPWPLYRVLPLIFVTHGSHALGVARAAIDATVELAQTKLAWGANRPLREQTRTQAVVAEASILVDAARSYMYASAARLWEQVAAGEEPDAALRAQVRLATSHAARSAVRAVDLLYDASATSAIFTKSPLERPFRDIHTAAAHVMVSQLTYEAAGRVALGLPAEMPFF